MAHILYVYVIKVGGDGTHLVDSINEGAHTYVTYLVYVIKISVGHISPISVTDLPQIFLHTMHLYETLSVPTQKFLNLALKTIYISSI